MQKWNLLLSFEPFLLQDIFGSGTLGASISFFEQQNEIYHFQLHRKKHCIVSHNFLAENNKPH